MTEIFSKKFLDIMSRNISNKILTCNDKDAPWMTSEVKTAIKRNARVHRKWVLRGRLPEERDNVRSVQNETNKLIKAAKQNHFRNLGVKLSNYQTRSKSFWATFKRLVNKKKITNILSKVIELFLIFKKKAIFSMIIFLCNVP